MLTALHNYVDSLDDPNRKNHLRLVIENGAIVTKTQKEINCWNRFKAWLGCGNASFKNVCDFIRRNKDEIFKDPLWKDKDYKKNYETLKDTIKVYNTNHLFFKKVKRLELANDNSVTGSYAPIDQLDEDTMARLDTMELFPELPEYEQADAKALTKLCTDLRHKWTLQTDWTEDDLDNMMNYFYTFTNAILVDKSKYDLEIGKILAHKKLSGINNPTAQQIKEIEDIKQNCMKKSLGRNAEFINALLQLRICINEGLVKGITREAFPEDTTRLKLKNNLKEVQETALTAYFEKTLELQWVKYHHYNNYYETEYTSPAGYNQPKSLFLESELKHWEKKLKAGKPISLPKWFHCTDSKNIVPMINSDIQTRHQKAYFGAFASTTPEIGVGPGSEAYGNWGFAMPDHIETVATTKPDGSRVWPKHSIHAGNPTYGDVYVHQNAKGLPVRNFIYNPVQKYWVGYQRNIPLASVSKRERPLDYYEDTTLGYLFYKVLNNPYGGSTNDRNLLLSNFPAPATAGSSNSPAEQIKILAMKRTAKDHIPDPSPFKDIYGNYAVFKNAANPKNCLELKDPKYTARKVRVISCIQLEEICKLFKTSGDTFCFPVEWNVSGNFVPC